MRRYLLLTIIVLAALLRLYKLDSYPVSLSWDEVAIGYNAFSIAQTGKDEYGKKLPLLFQSFNDYKLPGYIYLDSLIIKLFGFSDFTVRLPSALMGTVAVYLIYLLTKKLFTLRENREVSAENINNPYGKFSQSLSRAKSRGSNNIVPLLAMFLLAISPWHLQFSRAAFESNISLTVLLAGIVLLLYGLKNKIAAAVSIPVLFFSLYFYYSPRIFVPLILAVFLIIYRREITKNIKIFAIGLSVAIIISLPIISETISKEGQKRVREVSIFANPSLAQVYSEARASFDLPLANIFLNQRIPYITEVLKNYASHFSSKFLFFADDPNPRHRTPYHGNFYLFEVATILLGLWLLVKMNTKSTKFLLIWLAASPIPAALAVDAPHSLRALLMLIPLVIISAIGANEILKKRFLTPILILVAAIFFLNYLIGYFLLYPRKDSTSWAYGYRELYQNLKVLEADADSVIVTGHYWKPYIFYLYYNKVDPSYYQKSVVQEKIGKYNFGTTYWDSGGRDLLESDIESLARNKQSFSSNKQSFSANKQSFSSNKTILALSPPEYELLSDKSKFKSLSEVYDYSGRTILFKIGEWE